MQKRPLLRGLTLSALVLAASLLALELGRVEPGDQQDEAEWTAISIVHWQQLAAGTRPPGRNQREEGEVIPPYRSGVQGTSFGWLNPALGKLIWGGAAAAAGYDTAPTHVFQKYHQKRALLLQRAYQEIRPALLLCRRVVWITSALCALTLFWLGAAIAGPVAAIACPALWLASPLIRQWSHYVRPDFFMVLLSLCTLGYACLASAKLSGRKGTAALWRSATVLGALCGLCVSAKFNGAVTCLFAGVALPSLFLAAGKERRTTLMLGLLPASLLCLLACALVFWGLYPALWAAPFSELREILAFWDRHMQMQQERWADLGGSVAMSLQAKVDLALARTLGRDEPLRALTGLPGGVALLGLGFVAMTLVALRRFPARRSEPHCSPALLSVLFIMVTAAGSTFWLPLDWDRYFFLYVVHMALLEGALLGLLALWIKEKRTG